MTGYIVEYADNISAFSQDLPQACPSIPRDTGGIETNHNIYLIGTGVGYLHVCGRPRCNELEEYNSCNSDEDIFVSISSISPCQI